MFSCNGEHSLFQPFAEYYVHFSDCTQFLALQCFQDDSRRYIPSLSLSLQRWPLLIGTHSPCLSISAASISASASASAVAVTSGAEHRCCADPLFPFSLSLPTLCSWLSAVATRQLHLYTFPSCLLNSRGPHKEIVRCSPSLAAPRRMKVSR